MSVNLDRFCDPAWREPVDLSVPFSLNGHTYATDGVIAVRVPRRPDIPENKEAPSIEKLERLPWDFSRVKFERLPEFKPEPNECWACDGTGHQHKCPDCHCECQYCNGSGKRTPLIRIGKVAFNARYMELIQRLPGLEIGKPRRSRLHPRPSVSV